jgi:hypothetical protein
MTIPRSFEYTSPPSISDTHVSELTLDVASVLDSSSRLVVPTSDRGIALRTTRGLHRHAAFTHCERMSVLASVPVARATELALHGGDHHPHLTLVASFAQKAANIIDLSGHADSLGWESGAKRFSGVQVPLSVALDALECCLVTVTTISRFHDLAFETSKMGPENVAFCLLENVRVSCSEVDQEVAKVSVWRKVDDE